MKFSNWNQNKKHLARPRCVYVMYDWRHGMQSAALITPLSPSFSFSLRSQQIIQNKQSNTMSTFVTNYTKWWGGIQGGFPFDNSQLSHTKKVSWYGYTTYVVYSYFIQWCNLQAEISIYQRILMTNSVDTNKESLTLSLSSLNHTLFSPYHLTLFLRH